MNVLTDTPQEASICSPQSKIGGVISETVCASQWA